ncbi:MAG: Electron transfer flavoprotein, alpha subunit [Firmicutes bacterium]|nr:Electron transfer flavoprotein, alpha subunit [Bacillota bacterium]
MGFPLEAKTKDLWVFIETLHGKARNVGLELLNPGRRLADIQGGNVTAVVIGYNCDEAVKDAIAYGADKVYVMDAPVYDHYTTEAYTAAFVQLVEKDCPTTVLLGASNTGRDLGPRLAGRLRTGLTADCTALDIDEASGNVAWTRPAFGGNLMATILCPNHRPQIGTCRPGVFKKIERNDTRTAEIVKDDFVFPAEQIRVKLLEVLHEAGEKVDLEGAEIIVSGGRGVGGPEGFAPVRALASALGGVTGSSRAAVDAGWIPHSHQVGQTGKTVGPKLYVACGISGAIQHLAGMGSSETIVCINKDADANIFSVADFGVVGNLFEVLPVLTDLVNKSKG